MKKYILATLAILLVAAVVWCILMDPVSIRREDVGSIDISYSYSIYDSEYNPVLDESTFTVTDKNHIHYITDFLNNLLPIPGNTEYPGFHRILTIRDHQGNSIKEVTLYGHDHFITDKGTFQADVSELNRNLSNIKNGESIRTSMMHLPLLLIGWLLVIVVISLAGLMLFLIQMGICAKTDSLALRLLPTAVLLILCLFNFRTQFLTGAFYIASLLAFNDPWIGALLIGGAAVLCIILGWRQGSGMRRQK